MTRVAISGLDARTAVELLVQSHPPVPEIPPEVLYQAAVRIVLRLVFLSFAEANRLLPVDNPVYLQSYSLSRLHIRLANEVRTDPVAATARATAWPHLKALFRLVHGGSDHPALPVRAYGGELFEPGRQDGNTPAQAIALLENPHLPPDNMQILLLLNALRGDAGRRRLRDFTRLPTATIGILYEGLLEYELKATTTNAWKLIRSSVVRKSAGAFYTPPELAEATVQKTLEPLFKARGKKLSPAALLRIRICDPAMGSGAFLVAALKILSFAIESAIRVSKRGSLVRHFAETTVVRLGPGMQFELPGQISDTRNNSFLEAHIRRYVVEHCLYGVDYDPVAVELGRLSLWLETMDHRLPFTFLDHKLKLGNSLVGTWLQDLSVYPYLAWQPAKQHNGPLAATIRARKNDAARQLEARLAEARSPLLPFAGRHQQSRAIQQQLASAMEEIHRLPIQLPDQKRVAYRDGFLAATGTQTLRFILNRWSSIWFWPPESSAQPPDPDDYYLGDVADVRTVTSIAGKERFFHWELEFPEVFRNQRPGFHAIVGNPPWEVIKQGKGGQDRALATFMTSRDRPGGRFDAPLRSLTSESSSDQELPFCRQGRGDLNTYKLFLEQAAFLVRPEGRLGLVVPAGIYAEQGARDLRRMLLNKWRWEWLFAFTNRNRIFPIDNRFKFAVIVACRAGPTRRLKTAFMKQNLEEWQNAEEHSMNWPVSSSMRRAGNPFPEFTSRQEMDRFTRLTAAGMSFHQRGRNALQASYRRELDASLRQRGIRPVDELRKEGRILDRLGCSVPSSGEVNLHDIGLPVYQGVMIGQFDAAAARWVKGQGRRAVWAPLSATRGRAEAQFYMTAADYAGTTGACLDFKVAVRRITNASNVRTVIAALIPPLPCSDKVAVLSCDNHFRLLAATAMLNSFCVDWVARLLCTAANLDRHHLERLPLCPTNAPGIMDPLPLLALRLNGGHIWFAPLWRKAARQWPILLTRCWQDWWCTGPEEQRIVRSVVEALVAQAFSFDHKDLTQLLSECDHSRVQLDDRSFTARLKPRGFWRVDRHLPHHKRLPSLTLEAFHKLSIEGCEALMTDLLPSGSKDCSASVAASWDACHEWADRIDDLLSGLRSMSHQGQESLLLPCATHA